MLIWWPRRPAGRWPPGTADRGRWSDRVTSRVPVGCLAHPVRPVTDRCLPQGGRTAGGGIMPLPRMARPADRGGRAWRWGAVLLVVSLGLSLASLFGQGLSPHGMLPPAMAALWTIHEIVGIVMAVRAGRHRGLDRQSRRAWAVIGISYVLLTVSGTLRLSFPAGEGFP